MAEWSIASDLKSDELNRFREFESHSLLFYIYLNSFFRLNSLIFYLFLILKILKKDIILYNKIEVIKKLQ